MPSGMEAKRLQGDHGAHDAQYHEHSEPPPNITDPATPATRLIRLGDIQRGRMAHGRAAG